MREYVNSRPKLIQACIELLAQTSPGTVSIESVAKLAGISKGGLLHNFKSKRELLQNVLMTLSQEIEQQVNQKMESDPNPRGRFMRSHFSVFLENERSGSRIHTAIINCLIEIHRSELEIRGQFRLFRDRYKDRIEDENLPYETILLLSAAMDGIMLGLLNENEDGGAEERQALLEHMIRLTSL